MAALTISLIQTALHWEDPIVNLQMLEQKIIGIREKTELVILPEMFSTGFTMQPGKVAEPMDGQTVQWMKDIARRKNVILTGSLIIKENELYYNRLLWVLPNGQLGYYDKRHLFAYAGEQQFYSAGGKKLMARVKGWKIYPIVCYDLRFPVWVRQPADAEKRYDALVCVANWPASRVQAWNTLLQARAIENQCYVIGVNRTGTDGNSITYNGHSGIIDPRGEIVVRQEDREDIMTFTLQKEEVNRTRKEFPFLDDADRFRLQQVKNNATHE